MSRITDPERHEKVLDFFSRIHADSIRNSLYSNVGRVLKESHGRSTLEDRLKKCHLVIVWLKHAIRQFTFVFLHEPLVKRVFHQEALDFLLSKKHGILDSILTLILMLIE